MKQGFSGAVAGEAKEVFTRGVLHFLSLYFVFSFLCFFCLVLFASFQKTQKIVLFGLLALFKNTKKLVPALVAAMSRFGPTFISPMVEISTFKQKIEESFKEAWSRISAF